MITVLKKNTFFDEWGTRKSEVEFQGKYSKEDIDKQLATDAPYGWWLNARLVDTENNIYRGVLHEYWD